MPLFHQLGLNLYESKAYATLLARGQVSPSELGGLTLIPQSRTYDTLVSLKDKGFALTTPSSSKAVYTAAEPSKILSTLYSKKRKEIQEQMIKIHEETERKLETLYSIYSQALEKVASLSQQRPVPIATEPVFVIEGNDNIENAMLTMIDNAMKEFLRITRPPSTGKWMFDPFYFTKGRTSSHLNQARDRGVAIRTLSLPSEIPSLLGLHIEVEEFKERRYLNKADDIYEKFILVDGRIALLNLRDPVSKTFGSIALMIESKPTCSILKQHFEAMWKKASNVSNLVKRMNEATQEVCLAMRDTDFSKLECAMYKILANEGAMDEDSLATRLAVRGRTLMEVHQAYQETRQAGLPTWKRFTKASDGREPSKTPFGSWSQEDPKYSGFKEGETLGRKFDSAASCFGEIK